MAPFTFADTYNMVVFLSKFDASEGFDQIVDFLNAHTIQYALVLRALIDGKKVVVTEDVIRRDLHLDDADGVECLPNEEIFSELARMGYEKPPPKLTFYKAFLSAQWKFLIHTLVQCLSAKRTAWNEFSCSMASALLHVENLTSSRGCNQTWGKIEAIDVNEDITLVDMEKDEEVVTMDVEPQERIDQEDVNAASKGVNTAEATVFDDEEVTITMAQTLIKMKVEKAKLLDEQIAQKLHDEEKPVSIAQARKNIIIYLKNMAGYKMEHFRGMTYEKVRPIFKKEYNKVQTLFKPDKDVEEPKKKRVADVTLLQESFKKLKAVEVSGSKSTQEIPSNDPKEMSKEDVQNIVGGITEAYQSFEDMLKGFDREDLFALWNLVKEKFSSAVPSVDKEKALWVELKRLFEPDADDLKKTMRWPETSDEELHGGQQTKEKKFGCILQVIKMFKVKKLDV
nr:hypothetical protein [Tanacetum cinerariifolium]